MTREGEKNKLLKQKFFYSQNIKSIVCSDKEYPILLKQIYDPPKKLFIQGQLGNCNPCLAIVGPRKPSIYGRQVAEKVARDLAKKGITIVSGLANGIDSIAHQAALSVNGKTVAVLGSGINCIYPKTNHSLAKRIANNSGALVSEYTPEAKPTRKSFPQRNRIIAGMSLGTLVIEARQKSGTLITSQCTLDSGRELFVLPQNITSPTSVGANNLIKNGAHLITSATEILEILNI